MITSLGALSFVQDIKNRQAGFVPLIGRARPAATPPAVPAAPAPRVLALPVAQAIKVAAAPRIVAAQPQAPQQVINAPRPAPGAPIALMGRARPEQGLTSHRGALSGGALSSGPASPVVTARLEPPPAAVPDVVDLGPTGPVLALSDAPSANDMANFQIDAPELPPAAAPVDDAPPAGERATQAVTVSASAPTWVWVAGGVAILAIVGAGVTMAVRKKR